MTLAALTGVYWLYVDEQWVCWCWIWCVSSRWRCSPAHELQLIILHNLSLMNSWRVCVNVYFRINTTGRDRCVSWESDQNLRDSNDNHVTRLFLSRLTAQTERLALLVQCVRYHGYIHFWMISKTFHRSNCKTYYIFDQIFKATLSSSVQLKCFFWMRTELIWIMTLLSSVELLYSSIWISSIHFLTLTLLTALVFHIISRMIQQSKTCRLT